MRFLVIILFLGIIIGCESVVDFPAITNGVRYPVIEAVITNLNEAQKVRVSYTTALDDSLSSLPVSNAHVFVYSNVGDTVVYHYTEDGWYASDPFYAVAGKTYTLTVSIDSAIFNTPGSIIPMHGIDSLYAKHVPDSNKDSAYFVSFNAGGVDPDFTRYYQINIYKNDSLLTGGTNIAVFSDEFLTALNGINLPFTYLRKDTVVIELFSISKEMFDYYLSLTTNIFSLNYRSSGYQTNPPQMFGISALGYFQVSAVDKKQIIIH